MQPIKKTILITTAFISLNFLFANCKSNQQTNDVLKQDSIAKAATALAANTSTTQFSKYIINPPDSDYTGDYLDRYPSGIVKFKGFYRFGKRHGQWMAFYENGEMWSECFYDKGNKNGSSKVFYSTGNLQYQGWFKNDLRDSLWFFYDQTGKEIDKRAYRNDIETGLVN